MGSCFIEGYFIIMCFELVLVSLRSQGTFIDGRRLFYIHMIFALIFLSATYADRSVVSEIFFLFLVTITLLFWKLRKEYLILNAANQAVQERIEKCLKMTLLPFDKIEDSYYITFRDSKGLITIFSKFSKCAILYVESGWPQNKKRVFIQLLKKQFNGMLPRIVFHFK